MIRKKKSQASEVRFSLRLPTALRDELLKEQTRRRDASLNDIIVGALTRYVDPAEADKREQTMLRAVERVEREAKQIKWQNEALTEAFAVLVKFFLKDMNLIRSRLGITGEESIEALKIVGGPFQTFLEMMAEGLGQGGSIFQNLPDQYFSPNQFARREIEDDGTAEVVYEVEEG